MEMIWPIKTVRDVETCQVRYLVTMQVQAAELPFHHERATSQLTKAVENRFGVYVDIRDCDRKLIDEDHDQGTRTFLTGWRPRWMNVDVEFVDGPLDGKLYAVPNIRNPIIAVIESTIDAFRISGDPNPREFDLAIPKRITYNLAGWNDRTRRWVFSPEGSVT